MKNPLHLLLAGLFACFAVAACSDSDPADDPAVKDTLTLSPVVGSLTFSASGKTLYADGQPVEPRFRVATSAASWDVGVVSGWCSVEKDEQNGSFLLKASPCTSETQAPEPAVVTLRAGTAAPVEITVSQRMLAADVYVAGNVYFDPMIPTAVYWRNGELFPLVERGIDSYAKQIQVVGGDVYVSGGYEDAAAGGLTGYWKNGEFHALPGERKPQIYEFRVTDAGDIYAVGYDRFQAVYWKNGEIFRMESVSSYAYGMWVDGDDLHAVGVRYVSGKGMVGAYWKNGTLVFEADDCELYSVCVDGGKVYMLGMEKSGSEEEGTDCELPFYMVDGVRHRLSEEPECTVDKIRILDGRVVCTGTGYYYEERLPENVDIEIYYAQYWVDGAASRLTADKGEALGATSFNGSVYVAGEDFDPIQVLGRAVYWKDGVRVALDDTLEAVACDIALVHRE